MLQHNAEGYYNPQRRNVIHKKSTQKDDFIKTGRQNRIFKKIKLPD